MNKALFFMFFLLLYSCTRDVDLFSVTATSDDQDALKACLDQCAPLSAPEIMTAFSDTRILGLGEATHGSHELFIYKTEIIKQLIEHDQFRHLVFEMDVAEAQLFNDFIHGKINTDLKKLMQENMLLWIWKTDEMQSLLEWMRAYNLKNSPADQVYFYGCDNQFNFHQIRQLIHYAEKNNPRLAEKLNNLVRAENNTGINASVETAKKIITLFSDKDFYLSSDEQKDVDRLLQSLHYFISIQNADAQQPWIRDAGMASQLIQLAEKIDSEDKIILWAHNLHIAKMERQPNMGHLLFRHFNKKYQSIALGFSEGTFSAHLPGRGIESFTLNDPPLTDASDDLFVQHPADHFSIIFSQLPSNDPLRSWLMQPRPLLSQGAIWTGRPQDHYVTHQLANEFDGLIYFRQVSASHPF